MTTCSSAALQAAQPAYSSALELCARHRGVVTGAARGLLASAAGGILTCTAYLGKCKMGIDLFEGPSFLHNALYWIVC